MCAFGAKNRRRAVQGVNKLLNGASFREAFWDMMEQCMSCFFPTWGAVTPNTNGAGGMEARQITRSNEVVPMGGTM